MEFLERERSNFKYDLKPLILEFQSMSKKRILILNGPNLNLLGKRETTIYGEKSFDDYYNELKLEFSSIDLDYLQSNDESELIKHIHESTEKYDGIVINPAAYGHTS